MMPALGLMVTWGGAGNAMIIYLAGLKNIPRELYESADIDGAGWWSRTFHITLPMLSRVLFFCHRCRHRRRVANVRAVPRAV